MIYDIYGPVRKPINEIIKKLEIIEQNFHIGQSICCNNPGLSYTFNISKFFLDFLLDIMNRQGARGSMAWLGPIIQNDPETLHYLPIFCLCELLFMSIHDAILSSYSLLIFSLNLYFDDQNLNDKSFTKYDENAS